MTGQSVVMIPSRRDSSGTLRSGTCTSVGAGKGASSYNVIDLMRLSLICDVIRRIERTKYHATTYCVKHSPKEGKSTTQYKGRHAH